jgi:ABC-type antimicrobial peptide transport system permease subunit
MLPWIIIATYFAVGLALAVWLIDDEEDMGWAAFVFFAWPVMIAAALFVCAVSCVFMAPAYVAKFISGGIARLKS